jgi:hypothetical protein
MQQDGDLDRVLDQDFASIAKLGFDTVVIRHVEDGDRSRVVEAARRCGLVVALPSREVLYYVRTGRLPEGRSCVKALAAAAWPAARDEPAPIAVVGEASDGATASRVGRVTAALRDQRKPLTTFAVVSSSGPAPVTLAARPVDAAGEAAAGDVLLLKCAQALDGQQETSGWRWLGQYHAGLAAGLTGGVIVDGFRVVPGRWGGLVEGTTPLNVKRSAAIRRITARAATWGPRLRRLTPGAIQPLGHSSDGLKVVLFGGAKRRFVMLFNSSSDRFLHHRVELPATLDSRPVRRAVLVPPEEHVIAGEVVQPRSGRLGLPIDLAPGDACLWEVF